LSKAIYIVFGATIVLGCNQSSNLREQLATQYLTQGVAVGYVQVETQALIVFRHTAFEKTGKTGLRTLRLAAPPSLQFVRIVGSDKFVGLENGIPYIFNTQGALVGQFPKLSFEWYVFPSQDLSRLAYFSGSPSDPALNVTTSDGQRIQIAEHVSSRTRPSWTRDGKLFYQTSSGHLHLYDVGVRTVRDLGTGTDCGISASGDVLACAKSAQNSESFIQEIVTGHRSPFLADRVIGAPVLSPDSKYIFYVRRNRGVSSLIGEVSLLIRRLSDGAELELGSEAKGESWIRAREYQWVDGPVYAPNEGS
jgi:hypothetical protein